MNERYCLYFFAKKNLVVLGFYRYGVILVPHLHAHQLGKCSRSIPRQSFAVLHLFLCPLIISAFLCSGRRTGMRRVTHL